MHIHVLGICGTFMGSLAVLAKELGHRVTGSDANVYPPMSTQLEAQGIERQRALRLHLRAVQHAHHGILAEYARHDGQAKIHLAPLHPQLEAPVLREPSLADVELGFLVRERYVAAVAAASRVALARDVVERNEELARIAGVLVEVGREPPLRALRAEAALAEARAELQAAQAASSQAA